MKSHILTTSTKASQIKRVWHLLDAKDKTLGRFATEVAELLVGKKKPLFAPYMDSGDYVVVINADKIKVTGKKITDKMYYRHSQIPGGFKGESFKELMNRKPEGALTHAIRGMLPKNKLRANMLKRLRVVAGEENPFADKFSK